MLSKDVRGSIINVVGSGKLLLMVSLAITLATPLSAQPAPSSPEELFQKIASLDNALFATFNECNLDKFRTFFSEDIEFYHDRSGLATSVESLVDSLKNNICGKVRRELVSGSLEVYPIPGYGAMEAGAHRFFQREPGSTAERGGNVAAKFLHIWQYKDGAWKITRVVSYAH